MHRESGLFCMYTNADSLLNKREELLARISTQRPDIIFITELLPKNMNGHIELSELNLPGYDIFTNIHERKRGVCIYTITELKAVPVDNIETNLVESVWAEIKLKNRDKLLAGCIYRSPNCTLEGHAETRKCIEKAENLNYTHLLINGDFNYPDLKWNPLKSPNSEQHPASLFLECLRDSFLYQHVREPTHSRSDQSPTTIDLVITNEETMLDNLCHNAPLGKSHHDCLTYNFKCYSIQPVTHKQSFKLNKGNYENLRNDLGNITWFDNEDIDPDTMWCEFQDKLLDKCREHIPVVKQNTSGRHVDAPWMTDTAKKKIIEKKEAYTEKIQNNCEQTRIKYSQKCNQVKWECRKAKREYERKIAMNAKTNPKAFYKYAHSKMKVKAAVGDLKRPDGSIAQTDSDKVETLNDFFSSVFNIDDNDDLPAFEDRPFTTTLETLEINPSSIEKNLSKLNTSKSAGPDEIHPRILKEVSTELSRPLAKLYKKSLQCGKVPQQWKEGHITPIFKQKGSRNDPSNYRPVQLTSVISKDMESHVKDAIMKHVLSNYLLSKYQHGFINGKSCSTNLILCLDAWTKILDSGGSLDIIYLDLMKAFDKISHRRLLKKLWHYGIRGEVYNWIKDFLKQRRQRVTLNGNKSDWSPVTSGIPQGSVLGPTLFIIFINDLPSVVQSFIQMFADDSKIFNEISTPGDAEDIQTDLRNLESWTDAWKLKFNESKCKVVHIGKKNPKIQYKMSNGTILEKSTCEKDLGVHVDHKLTFAPNVDKLVNKANSKLGLIRRSYTYLDEVVVSKLYTSLVRPSLEYGNVAWSPVFKKDADAIERVQRRATKLVPKLKLLSYPERLKKLKLPSMYYRRARGDMIETFKYMTDIYKAESPLVRDDDRRTRGHHLKLRKPPAKTQIRKNFFSFRVVNLWNSLPEDIVSSPSVNTFKNRLDKHWSHVQYIQDFLTVNAIRSNSRM